MITVLHALWDSSGELHLWAESSALSDIPPKRGKRRSKRLLPHPFALDSDSLRELAVNLSAEVNDESAKPGNLTILLPSTSTEPLASSRLICRGEMKGDKETNLVPWEIVTVALAPDIALDFLLSLPNQSPHGLVFGGSLCFWIEAAKLSIELIARQCFIPTIRENRLGNTVGPQAVWETLIEGEDRERVQLLSDSMPSCCRAIQHPDDGGSSSPAALVLSFLDQTVDAFVRRSLSSKALLPPSSRRGKTASLPEQWLEALSSRDPEFKVSAEELTPFSQGIQSWLSQVQPVALDTPLRTCFRLDPPDDESQEWEVGFHLQAKEDPSLLIPAQKVWGTRSGVLTFLKRRFENPQERLLADLGRASRIFPAIEQGLKTACPTEVRLGTESAYLFMRQFAPLLEQSGFGVLLPAWWQRPTRRLSVRLNLRPKAKTRQLASGLLGMDAIVAYDWEIALGDELLSPGEFEELANLKVPLVKVHGQWVEFKPEEIERAIAFFQRKASEGEMKLNEAMRIGLGQEVSELGLPVTGVDAEGWIGELLDRLCRDIVELPGVEPPRSFNGQLRPYQTKGLSWLAFLRQFGLGACLADDMGLGKTIEFVALMLYAQERNSLRGSTLLICPMSVVGNWKREVERFAPSLRVMVHHGPDRASGSAFKKEAKRHDLVITTYALAYRDKEMLGKVDWECVVLDEAQNIKNPSAKQTQAIRKLNASYKVALTGTPVENRLSELWSIMEFLNPGYLRSAKDFHSRFVVPIEKFRNPGQTERLKRLIQPFVLRRVKTDPTIINDLPEKIETKVFCNLTREQATLYEAVVREMMGKIEELEGIERKGLVLTTLLKLKQVCNHPAQLLQDRSSLPGRSGKLTRLEEILEETLAEGDKALIFTQFAHLGRLLQRHLQETFACEVPFLHGGTSKRERDAMIQRFQDDHKGPPLFILSLKAGGLGLNLTAANHVFHFDRWWNPAVENQATDRVFRIGQKKNVQVHKFVCFGTVEERIDQMIEQKKELAESVVSTGEALLTEMSTQQLREVFALSREAVGEN